MCFIITSIFIFGKIAHIAITAPDPIWQRMIFTFLLFGLLGIAIIETVRGVNNYAKAKAAKEAASPHELPKYAPTVAVINQSNNVDSLPTETAPTSGKSTTAIPTPKTGSLAATLTLASIKKVDKFATVVPFDTANKNMPIPMNVNYSDSKSRFYRDLLTLADRPEKQRDGTAWPVERNLATEDYRSIFIGRLLQFYVFSSIDELQRDSEGIEWTIEKGSRPIVRVGIVPPESTPYATNVLLAELSKSEFLSANDRRIRENARPFSTPKSTKMSLVEHPSSPATGVAQYIVRLARPGYFLIDFKITPTFGPITVAGVAGASIPKGFQPAQGIAPTTLGYPFIVTMTYEIHKVHDATFQPDDYAKWADALFIGLKQRMAYE